MGTAMKISASGIILLLATLFFCGTSYFLYRQSLHSRLPHQDIDSQAYLAHADLFYKNNSFAWVAPEKEGYPYYTLGYAFILAIIYKIFGQQQHSVIILQVLLALLCALLVYDVIKKIFKQRCGVIGYVFVCTNIGFLVFAQFLLAELWLAFFLLLFFHRLVSFLHDQQRVTILQAGLFLSCSVLIKPAALYFWPLLLPLFWVGSQASVKRFLTLCLVWCCAFYVPLVAYAFHNKMVFNRWYVCKLDTENMLYWFFPNVLACKYDTDQNIERRTLRLLPALDVKKKFMSEFKASPHLFFGVWIKNVVKTWLGLFTTNVKVLVEPDVHGGDISYFKTVGSLWTKINAYICAGATHWWVCAVGYYEAIWSLIRFGLSILGLLFFLQRRNWSFIYLVIAYCGYFSGITGHDGCARFRMLFEFVLIILAAIGLDVVLWSLKRMLVSLKNHEKKWVTAHEKR